MPLSIKARGDVFALSRRQQADARTFASIEGTGNTEGMLVHTDEASTISVVDERRDDQDQKTGYVEPTNIDILTRRSEGSITIPRAAPDPLAWMAAFFTASSNMVTPAGGTNARLHTSRVRSYAEDPPYFTCVHRKGGKGGAPAMVERIIGNAINVFRFTLTKGEFVSCAADIQGIGYVGSTIPGADRGIYKQVESVDFTTLKTATLDHDADGASATDGSNIQAWCDADGDGIFELPLGIVDYDRATDVVEVDEGGQTLAGNLNVEFTYPVLASATGYYGTPSWRTQAEALVIQPEFKLRAGSMQIRIGGTITDPGTDAQLALDGGQIAACEVESLEYTGDWQGQVGYCWRAGATEELNATQVVRGDLRQTIRVNRRVRDYLFSQRYLDNAFLSVYVDAIGPEIESGQNFAFKAWFPRVKFLTKPYQVSEGRWIDAGELLVLAPQPAWTTDGLMDSAVFQVVNAVDNGGNGYLV